MLLLSIGTGQTSTSYSYDEAKDWGLAKWIKPALDMMMDGVADTVDYQLRQIFDAAAVPQQYLRINGEMPTEIDPGLDCVEPANLKALRNFADQLFATYQQDILSFLKM